MKLKLKETPEQIELIKALGSKKLDVSRPAMEAFAAFLGPVIQKVLSVAGTASMFYKDAPYNEDDSPSFPLDLYYGANENTVTVWSQSVAGGMPSSLVTGLQEMKFQTYDLQSAVSFLKKYARKARLDIVNAAIRRMSEELLVKQERNGWAVILKALAEGSTNGTAHFTTPTTADIFQIADLSGLMLIMDTINTSWTGGTTLDSAGITDLFVSPFVINQIRGFAYQPQNTRTGTITSSGATSLGLPDNVREEIYRSAGAAEIFGVAINKVNELGVGKKYAVLFDTFYTGSFAPATEELVVAIDASRDCFIRPVAIGESGQITVMPDDQFVTRSDKTGFWATLTESRVCIDSRAVTGLKV